MAAWQFPTFLVPDAWTQENATRLNSYLTENGWELDNAWLEFHRIEELTLRLDAILPRGKSWNGDMIKWQHADHESDVEIFSENGRISAIRFRLDLRGTVRPLAHNIVEVAQALQLSFLIMEKETIIPPMLDAYLEEAATSRAYEFIRDPRGFVESFPNE
ncbi:MAG: hypothetical protein AAFR20_09375 [Pseudomonadota bacterium]